MCSGFEAETSLAFWRSWEGQRGCNIASSAMRLKLEAEEMSSGRGLGWGFETRIRIYSFLLTAVRCYDIVYALRRSLLLIGR